MLSWSLFFFLIALAAAVFGFGGMTGFFASTSQFLTFLFIGLALATITYCIATGKTGD